MNLPNRSASVIETRVYPAASNDNPQALGAVSWGAIFAGAAAAAALSLVLLILGTGLGLSSVSPWVSSGVSAKAFGISTILWIAFTQLAASGLGGYLAGRLRTRWAGVPSDEVHFRDTAHGFMTWCVATLATAVLLTSAIGSIVGGTAKTVAAVGTTAAVTGAAALAGSDASGDGAQNTLDYFVDRMFRSIATAPATVGDDGALSEPANAPRPYDMRPATRGSGGAETNRIMLSALAKDTLPADDQQYLAQLVAERAGIGIGEAEDRVKVAYADAKQAISELKTDVKNAADEARKASAQAALWLFITLLSGAFVASWFATFGGRSRDA